jgi:hypothetical protein
MCTTIRWLSDIKDFESSGLRTARAGAVEGHQNGAIEGAVGGVNEPGDFFLAQDGGEAEPHLGVGRLGRTPGFLERLDEEEAQSRELLGDGAGGEFSLAEQLGLILANVLRTQLVRRAMEVVSEFSDHTQVTTYGIRRVITTIEFLDHQLA